MLRSGGWQVSSKIGVIESLLGKCDKLVIGGGMVFTFLKARGLNVGRRVEPVLNNTRALGLPTRCSVVLASSGLGLASVTPPHATRPSLKRHLARSSLVEEDKLELARSLEAKAAAKGVKIILPTDVVLADKFSADANTKFPPKPVRAASPL